MAPLALVLFFVMPLAAEPPSNHCKAWTGSHTRLPYRECGGVPDEALRYAQACMTAFGGQLSDRRTVVFGDWTVGGEFTRLHVLEWNQQDPYKSFTLLRGGLAHGEGNGSVEGEAPPVMKDQWNSKATPGGCMRLFGTGEAGQMSTAPSMKAYRLDGLEERNACVFTRGLYFHEYEDRVMDRRVDGPDPKALPFAEIHTGNLAVGFSKGCVSLNEKDFAFIKNGGLIPRTGGVLFVSWDGNGGRPRPRRPDSTASCTIPAKGVVNQVKVSPNIYETIMLENVKRLQDEAAVETGGAP